MTETVALRRTLHNLHTIPLVTNQGETPHDHPPLAIRQCRACPLLERRLPRLTNLWREVLPDAPDPAPEVPLSTVEQPDTHLPRNADDRHALALKVESLLAATEQRHVLRLMAWGDWADDARLRGALIIQERARREGLRLRLNYRYSYRQLALQLGASDHKVVSRAIRRGLTELAERLDAAGLLFIPGQSLPYNAGQGTISR